MDIETYAILKKKIKSSSYDDTDIKNRLSEIESDYVKSDDIPKKVSQLTNDSNYQTEDDITTTLLPYAKSSEVDAKVSDINSTIGDMTTIKVASAQDLVTAINTLYNSFMTGIKYADKKLTISYRNGQSVDIDISSIIVDTDLGELSNVNDDGITDNQVLSYDASTSKYVPTTIDLSSVLENAKAYTDTEIAKMTHMDAVVTDSKPIYEDGTITYIKDGTTYTTTNTDIWFYYTVDSMSYQTLFVDGVEFTVSVDGSVNFNDFVSKNNDLISTYTGTETDKTKVPTIAAIDALYLIVKNALGDKVNTADIVDNLASDATNKPLSANQGKVLDAKIVALGTSITTHADNSNVHVTLDDKSKWNTVSDKVDKEDGKSLLADTDKVNYDDTVSKAHSHDNKSVLDGITSDKVTAWDTVNNKVDKVDGKGLSTEDYTTSEKTIVSKLGESAEGSLTYNGSEIKPSVATTESTGVVKPDGTTITIDEYGTLHGQSKIDEMTGATAEKNGTSGTVPAPTAGQEAHILNGDGTWASPLDNALIAAKFEELNENKSDAVINSATGNKVKFTIENGIICAREA